MIEAGTGFPTDEQRHGFRKEHQLRTITVLIVSTLLGGCVVSDVRNDAAERPSGTPPQLWSDHKSLDVPVEVCGEKGYNVLNALGFSNVVRNGNYSYGNFDESRAAVKCVAMPTGSFVYFAVASADKAKAEELRNRIAWKF
jgi:hypothetical protein